VEGPGQLPSLPPPLNPAQQTARQPGRLYVGRYIGLFRASILQSQKQNFFSVEFFCRYLTKSKKQDTILWPITSPSINRFSKKNSLTVGLIHKFAANSCLNIQPHLKYVATLPRGISIFKNSQCSRSD